MKENVLEILYSDDDEFIECDACGEKVFDLELEICPFCNNSVKLPSIVEYGKRLPVGIIQNNILNKEFDLKKLTWGIEKNISAMMMTPEYRRTESIGKYIATILAHTVTNVGGTDITNFTYDKKIRLFNSMYQGDIFYMYAYLRLISVGHEMWMKNAQCINNNNHVFDYCLDVSSLKVLHIERPEQLKHTFELHDGIIIEKEAKKRVTIVPQRWEAIDLAVGTSEMEMFEKMFLSSLDSIEGMPDIDLPEHKLENITKTDMNIIKNNLDTKMMGPIWSIEIKCPQCNQRMFHSVNWMFDDFFTNSFTYKRR